MADHSRVRHMQIKLIIIKSQVNTEKLRRKILIILQIMKVKEVQCWIQISSEKQSKR